VEGPPRERHRDDPPRRRPRARTSRHARGEARRTRRAAVGAGSRRGVGVPRRHARGPRSTPHPLTEPRAKAHERDEGALSP
jgi:hypothetical protein